MGAPAQARRYANRSSAEARIPAGTGTAPRLRFAPESAFHQAVKEAVAAYFRGQGLWRSGNVALRLKTGVLVAWFAVSYVPLVFLARTWWQALPLALSVGFAVTGLGFNIHHDSNHGAYARGYRRNRALGFILDLLGGSSYVWRWKHNYFHHVFTNVAGHDADINGAPLLRMSPAQPLRPVHRYQHLYCWFLYTLFPIRWWVWDDYNDVARGHIEGHRFPRPRGWEAVAFVMGKLGFIGWSVALPLSRNALAHVAACYLVASTVLGICLALSAQLSHCVDQTAFPVVVSAGGSASHRLDGEWAAHQVRTCSGFSHGSRLANWFWGGLNFQVEHHLFPRVSHVHYPRIGPIVRATCRDFGLPYHENATLWQALCSHARMMRRMGRP